jgi:hypothetical protein
VGKVWANIADLPLYISKKQFDFSKKSSCLIFITQGGKKIWKKPKQKASISNVRLRKWSGLNAEWHKRISGTKARIFGKWRLTVT